jgi:ankyrin repeat protein
MILSFLVILCIPVLLQRGADPNIHNTDGKTALDLADSLAKAVLTGNLVLSCMKTLELHSDIVAHFVVCPFATAT